MDKYQCRRCGCSFTHEGVEYAYSCPKCNSTEGFKKLVRCDSCHLWRHEDQEHGCRGPKDN